MDGLGAGLEDIQSTRQACGGGVYWLNSRLSLNLPGPTPASRASPPGPFNFTQLNDHLSNKMLFENQPQA